MALALADVHSLGCCSAVSEWVIRSLKGLNEKKLLVLASDEEGGALDALRFSLASDIVELVVLTRDEIFLQTLRDALGGAQRLWHVPTADKVSDLLVAGEVGILVVDVQALNETSSVFIGQIKRQFPDLVVVVAGHREAEVSLAGMISAGTVYRFIHKPMSPGRAKLFAAAAVKKYEGQRRRVAPSPAVSRRPPISRKVLIAGGLGALGVIVAATWAVHTGDKEAGPVIAPTLRPAAESPLLVQAAAALAANHLTEPAGDNALELYLQARVRNPADDVARAGIAEVHERLLAGAENALLEERLDDAAVAIETARKSGVEGSRIAFLTAQLAKSREQVKLARAAARVRSGPKAEEDKVASLLQLAAQRVDEAHLIDPEGDSAVFYIREAVRLDPNSDAAQTAENSLALRLLAEARAAIDRHDFVHASGWLEAADGVASPANIEAAQALLAAAKRQASTESGSAQHDVEAAGAAPPSSAQ